MVNLTGAGIGFEGSREKYESRHVRVVEEKIVGRRFLRTGDSESDPLLMGVRRTTLRVASDVTLQGLLRVHASVGYSVGV